MKNLIKFELRKILTKRFAVISVAAVLLLSLILSFSTLHSMYAFDGNGTEETGKAAVEIDKQIALKYEGKLTDNSGGAYSGRNTSRQISPFLRV